MTTRFVTRIARAASTGALSGASSTRSSGAAMAAWASAHFLLARAPLGVRSLTSLGALQQADRHHPLRGTLSSVRVVHTRSVENGPPAPCGTLH